MKQTQPRGVFLRRVDLCGYVARNPSWRLLHALSLALWTDTPDAQGEPSEASAVDHLMTHILTPRHSVREPSD